MKKFEQFLSIQSNKAVIERILQFCRVLPLLFRGHSQSTKLT